VIALIFAMGGTGIAALTLPKNSVGTRQLRDGAVNRQKVMNHSLLAVDFKSGQLPAGPTGGTSAPGPGGPKGATGSQGPVGAKGDPGISGYVQVDHVSAFDSDTPKFASAPCPAGMTVIGGGITVNASDGPVAVQQSVPLADGSGCGGEAYETAPFAGNWDVDARAICAKVAP
jgi:hypothetical protein